MSRHSRRFFLTSNTTAAAALTFGCTMPGILQAAAAGSRADGRILVVVELAGGNDGLNTVVPFSDDAYRKARPKLALSESAVIRVADGIGLNPALRGFADLLESGRLAVVQGVGYPDPNRSHFESMDIWHTCQRKEEQRLDGWIGRFMDRNSSASGTDPAALHFGHDKQPFALTSRDIRVPSIQSLDQFRIEGFTDRKFQQAVRALADARRGADNDLLNFVQSSASSAIAASERIEQAGKQYRSKQPYPETDLARKLEAIARLIDTGLQTTVYYVQLDGFDTHAQQADAHTGLLRQLGDAVSSFLSDLRDHGHDERVAVMCFSEFGRRVAENASEGTDHGTAAPMFLAGTSVKAGVIGKHPSLTDLQDGDLKHHFDFRQVYATVLEDWLQCDSSEILKGKFATLDAFA